MAYKRILTIQDISCIGQCSMTVALPILSACGQETCILPSAVLSTHTGGFGKPVVRDLTEALPEMAEHWLREGISFDAIYTGYLGSVEAIEYAGRIIDAMLTPGGKVIVDPAMADHGKLYSGFDEAYAKAMAELCERSDVMLPNITEAAMMTGLPFLESYDEDYILKLLEKLGGNDVVLTGVGFEPEMTGFAMRTGNGIEYYHHPKVGRSYHGTGDIFASCFTGAWVRGKSMKRAAQIAADFTCRCIQNTFEDPAHWYGVKFETALPELVRMLDAE